MGIPRELVWRDVAAELRAHGTAGLQRFLTEDVLRFASVRHLAHHGVQPAAMRNEWRQAGISVDLAVGEPVHTAVEFKYPREPNETNAAWTQHLGELLKDFYRLAHLPEQVAERWCVQLVSDRLRRYLDGVERNYGVRLPMKAGDSTVLDAPGQRALPATAWRLISPWVDETDSVRARCVQVADAGAGLRLVVHRVEHLRGGESS